MVSGRLALKIDFRALHELFLYGDTRLSVLTSEVSVDMDPASMAACQRLERVETLSIGHASQLVSQV